MIDVEALSCQELVELVTDYLEGALSTCRHAALRRAHRRPATAAPSTSSSSARPSELTGTLTPDDLSPEAESALLDVFRSWNSAKTTPVE